MPAKIIMKTQNRESLRLVRGQPSWRLAASEVEAFVTQIGGQLGPVTFERRGRRIRPYSVAPWAEEPMPTSAPAILKVLRGDFFCMPFGGNGTAFGREKHPVHGETANARWRFESLQKQKGKTCLHLSLKTKIRPARVDKQILLADGQNNVYCRHVVSGAAGPMCLGHHAMLKFPDEPGCGLVSTSRVILGQVLPVPFELPEQGGYSFLKPGASFQSLQTVPALSGETADLSRYPARRGFEDLVMLVNDASEKLAWTAVAFPKEGYVWFGLKDPRVLRHTVLWLSNGGRHYPPWSGRHVNVMGLEEVTAYFHLGLAESAAPNPLSQAGHPTCVTLEAAKPLVISYIMGTAKIPAGFDRVVSIQPAAGGREITLESASGKQARAAVDVEFLHGDRGLHG
jgi:hypothetical protein